MANTEKGEKVRGGRHVSMFLKAFGGAPVWTVAELKILRNVLRTGE